MSIYATLWHLQFPRHGDAYVGCEWVDVFAQGVPAHIGTPTPGYGYQSGDPYESFLPPALRIDGEGSESHLRAVVFVAGVSGKGTARSGQEYESPLLVLTGIEYAEMPFQVLHDRLCSALRGAGPRLVLEVFPPDGVAMLVFEDGFTTSVAVDNASTTMPSSSSDEGRRRMAQITINEGLAWLKTLKKRHEELLALRNDNAHRERRFYGASADKEIVKEPLYDVKILDRLVTRVAREIRLLEQALKTTNAKTTIEAYEQDDGVLGELS